MDVGVVKRELTRFPERVRVGDEVVEEAPLQIRLHGEDLAVLMRTPGADRALVAGFLRAEGVITDASDLRSLGPCEDGSANVMVVELREGCPWDVEAVRRTALSTSSCGICGKTNIENLLNTLHPLPNSRAIPLSLVTEAGQRASRHQRLFQLTGGLHAAALFGVETGELLAFAEDVGRHNAVDKTLGDLLLQDVACTEDRLLWISGRASFEVLQKAVASRVCAVLCVGAPTSMAIDLAIEANMLLAGFYKGSGGFNLYAGTVSETHEATEVASPRLQEPPKGV